LSEPEDVLVTLPELISDFRELGIERGMTLLVHSSMRKIGYVCGGAQAVIMALEEVLGPKGTLVMPTHTGVLGDPEEWNSPPVPSSWWEPMRQTMPPYMPDLTPTYKMGAIPETFRKQNGVLRSSHPRVSFAAWGRHTERVTANHALDYCLGEGSPLARIYDLDGHVLLLGVGHSNNTSLHLAEYRADWPGKKEVIERCPMLVDGQRFWGAFQDVSIDEADFAEIGGDFGQDTGLVGYGKVGCAACLLMPQRALVDYAVWWMNANRGQGE
jgi:aminoglycoside 3-N-acetyltransferase